jgi:hypothetical protein
MIEENKLTAEEEAKMLAATGEKASSGGGSAAGQVGGAGKWLRVRVTDVATGRSKASVQIPVGLLDAGIKIGAQFAPQVEGLDPRGVLDAIRAGASGKILDVTLEADGEHIEIFVD